MKPTSWLGTKGVRLGVPWLFKAPEDWTSRLKAIGWSDMCHPETQRVPIRITGFYTIEVGSPSNGCNHGISKISQRFWGRWWRRRALWRSRRTTAIKAGDPPRTTKPTSESRTHISSSIPLEPVIRKQQTLHYIYARLWSSGGHNSCVTQQIA